MIRGRIETSLVDWDGKLATVLFFDRCNFACPYCQNWELMARPAAYPAVELEDVLKKLLSRKDWIDGVVLSGGEPMLDRQELKSVIGRIRCAGFKVKVDTNGSYPGFLEELITGQLVDYVAMDIKAPPDTRYEKATGVRVDPDIILTSIRLLLGGGVDYEFRTTLVPGIVDEAEIREIGERIRGASRWYLQVFLAAHAPPGDYRDKKYPAAKIERLLAVAREYVSNTKLRGTIT